MEKVKIVSAAVLFTVWFITLNRFPERWNINYKPFNCEMCLSAWVAIALFFLPTITTEIALVMFSASIAAPLFRNFITNLHRK